MHTSQLPSIATQQAEQIRQLKGQVARLSQSLQAADEHIQRLANALKPFALFEGYERLINDGHLADDHDTYGGFRWGDIHAARAAYDAWSKQK